MAILDKVFKAAIDFSASDVHIVPGEPFIIRRLARMVKLKSDKLSAEQTHRIISEILTDGQRKKLMQDKQLDFAYEISELGRFRGSAMVHNNGLSAVFRIIPPKIKTLEELGLPEVVTKVLDNHQGLILVTGATGEGKSTTLASMVDYINTHRAHHVLTIEDPIEFIHPKKRGVVNQRQLSRDTLSYENSLRAALREDPDVIVIGEMRSLDTISMAISAAETGHLVIGTMSTFSAPKTIDRIIDAYPPNEQNQIRAMLGESFRAVITQRLIPGADEKSVALATEILVGTVPMAKLIRDGKTFQIPSMMQTGKGVGMQIMDECISSLLQEGKITAQSAQKYANNPKIFDNFVKKGN
ncbi:type IV pilus twitching motility protein PilT [Thermodesulfobacteriota bacterium]